MTGEVVVEGEVERVTYESAESSFRVLKLAVEGRSERLTVVGTFPRAAVGVRLRVRGHIVSDAKYGEQLRVDSSTELAPSTLIGIEKYLGSGMIKGVGETYAKRIVATFGLETLKVLDETPDRLREVEGLGGKRLKAIATAWKEQRSVREVMVFLEAHGVSPALAMRIYKRYGVNTTSIVSRDPYRLALDVWGVGFKTADRIAAEIGIAKDSPERMQAGVLQAVFDATESGNTYTSEADIVGSATELLAITDGGDERLLRALESLTRAGLVVSETVEGVRIVFASEMHATEKRVALRIAELAHAEARPLGGAAEAIAAFEARAEVTLAPEQRSAIEAAARASVLVITGGPGVGKTTIVRALLSMLDRAGIVFRLAAPTGRAAKRMSESSGREASTLHRLLEFDPKHATFKRGKDNPLDAGAVVVDEASMIDLPMADALLQAVSVGARLILVGDVDQLPSVGPGAVLRDFIDAGTVPCVRLTRIFRQARESLIVTNAHRINAGEPPEAPDPTNELADFFVIDRRDADQARATILELVTKRIPHRFGLDPVRDIQVLVPMHRGPAGSVVMNEALQAALNPFGPALKRGDRLLRVGDKVMQLKNDYERLVFNGDVGLIASVDEEELTLVVRYEDREVVYDTTALDDLALAYAFSVHKSQGSEYPAVVIPLLTSHFVMLSRKLLYTAVTRGKRLVVLVADPRALRLALGEDRRGERRTRLASRISAGMVR